jgi:site-specific DNA-cytosine methylase
MKKLTVLDLFCGIGGASRGLYDAGLLPCGIDNAFHVDYPFFIIGKDIVKNPDFIIEYSKSFDLIWASPPCQCYSFGSKRWNKQYSDLIDSTRELLFKTGKPFVIENVSGAPIRKDLMLCGVMFGLKLIKHRYFEIHGFKVEQLKHKKHVGTVKNKIYVTTAGHGGDGSNKISDWQDALGIKWTRNKQGLANAIPPAYSKYIGDQFIKNQGNNFNT